MITLIDPILVIRDVSVFDSGVQDVHHTISDNKATILYIYLCLNSPYKRKVWLYKKADYDKLNLLITHTGWETLIIGPMM